MKRAKRDHWYEAAVYWVGRARHWEARALKAETDLQEAVDHVRVLMWRVEALEARGAPQQPASIDSWAHLANRWPLGPVGGQSMRDYVDEILEWRQQHLVRLQRKFREQNPVEEIEQSLPWGLKIETDESLPRGEMYIKDADGRMMRFDDWLEHGSTG